jgi:outer membrane receptor for ferrienterochelin and colicins
MFKKKVLVMLTALLILVVPVSAEEDVMDLDEVVVTASRYEESIMDTPVSIEVIDQEEIEESNAQNLAELLDTYTGVYIKDNGGQVGTKSVKIRGASSDQVLVLLDGVPYNDPHNGGLDLSNVSAENIEKIEIIKGPASVIYGANAMGGVVNIITKEIEDTPITKLDLGFGSDDTNIYKISHNEKIDNLGVYLSYLNKSSDTYLKENNLDQENIFLKINNDISRYSDITFNFSNNISDKVINNSDQNDEEQNLSLSWNRKKEVSETNFRIYKNDREREYPSSNSLHEKEQTGLFLNNTNYLDKHTFNYGFEFKEDKVNSTNIENGNKETTNKALFIKDNWNFNSKLDFTLAARYDDHEEYGSNLSPQVAISHSLNENYRTFISYSEAFKAPTFDDLYGVYPPMSGQDWSYPGFEGNPNLEAEESDNYEIGLKFDSIIGEGSISYFYREVTNLITNNYNVLPYTMKNVDDKSEFKGIELNIDNQLTEKLSSSFNYTYLDSQDNNGDRIAGNPYHNAKISLKYKKAKKTFFVSGKLISDNIDGASNDKMPSYFVVDSRVNIPIEVINQKVDLAFEINNLFDKDYEVVDGFPMPGRNFMVNLSTKF